MNENTTNARPLAGVGRSCVEGQLGRFTHRS